MTSRRYDINEGSTVMIEGIPLILKVEKHQGVFVTLRDMFGEKIQWKDWYPLDNADQYKYSYGEIKCHEKYVWSVA